MMAAARAEKQAPAKQAPAKKAPAEKTPAAKSDAPAPKTAAKAAPAKPAAAKATGSGAVQDTASVLAPWRWRQTGPPFESRSRCERSAGRRGCKTLGACDACSSRLPADSATVSRTRHNPPYVFQRLRIRSVRFIVGGWLLVSLRDELVMVVGPRATSCSRMC